MTTEEYNELVRDMKELYLEVMEMRLDDAIVKNHTKAMDEWLAKDKVSLSDPKRSIHTKNIEALKAEDEALRQLRVTIKKELAKVRK